MRRIAVAVALVAASAVSASAQVAWDSPMLVPPRAPAGFGLFLTDPHRADLGVLGTYRAPGAPANLQFRLGLAEGVPDGVAIFGGADFSGALTRATTEFPLDISWVAGAGAGIDGDVRVSFPLGLAVGRTFDADDVMFTPYVTPRVVVDAVFNGNDGLELDFAVDLGVDIGVATSWAIRFGGTVGDRDAVAIGLVF